ncbi:MAG: SoxR reducing system RseC family protein [Sphaerochaeta sp.]|jgi:sigma-E factor negative regulatory protein RseC|nr:SoxR reducing system RseC family protein [Sphaerochaeta sp.]MDX9914268.1 SoxR reducing system RseC family protein [Sphaerochaeta sp.]
MHEHVTITRLLGDDLIEVSCSSAACNGCKGSAFCTTKNRTFKAWNKEKLELKSGDTINLFLHPARTIGGTLITLIAPLVLFPVCYYLSKAAGLGEGASFLLSLGGIAVGFAGVWAYFRTRQRRYMPVVIQKQDHD